MGWITRQKRSQARRYHPANSTGNHHKTLIASRKAKKELVYEQAKKFPARRQPMRGKELVQGGI